MGLRKEDGAVVSAQEAAEQVVLMARRLALLYHYTAEVLVEQMGNDKARDTLCDIIWRYGRDSGRAARAKVEALGLTPTAANFREGSDLPKWGWVSGSVECEDGVTRGSVTYCPFAAVWKEKGSQELGRLYCLVDEAKYEAYNDIACRHLKNLLDGDDCCVFDIQEGG